MNRIVRSSILALTALTLLAGCDSGSPSATTPGGASPTPAASASPIVTPAPSPTPSPIVTPTPAALGWPRAGWTIHTGVDVGLASIAVYFPDSWYFDNNESGLWTPDGTYHVFCDPYVDHSLNDPGAPDAETIATTQWGLTGANVTNQHAIATFYGYEGWAGDFELPLKPGTVEHRAYVVVGDVWISCGAITRNTTASGDELWDVVDSIQIVDESSMPQHDWDAGF
jgi:hypothetical protein